MAVLTIRGLYERVRGAAAEHLGERAPRTLLAYEMGYDAGLWHHGFDPLVDELAGGLSAWVTDRLWMTDEHESRLNARTCLNPRTYALLRASDEADALLVYLDLWSKALAEFRAASGQPAPIQGRSAVVRYLDTFTSDLVGLSEIISSREAVPPVLRYLDTLPRDLVALWEIMSARAFAAVRIAHESGERVAEKDLRQHAGIARQRIETSELRESQPQAVRRPVCSTDGVREAVARGLDRRRERGAASPRDCLPSFQPVCGG
jgi:hypothetical protein